MFYYIPKENWPPNLPDLSLTENVWSIMAEAVYASPEPRTLMALERPLQKSGRSISLTTVQNLISSMHVRLKAVIRNKGDTVLTFRTNICTLS